MKGKTLGNYRILKKIGEGGMGSVYLARDLNLHREVALKVIAPQLARSSQLMARFRVEAIAQARLNHANIVTIHSFDHQDEIYYIVMEYVEGRTLKSIIKETGRIPVEDALSIISRILAGMDYAHGKGVLHRDIKPANIFITPDRSVKIGDFGIARVEGIEGLTRAGSAPGTPLYSSPEQIRGEKMGPGTDIYSLGITLYEMITGKTPFGSFGGSDFEIQKAHLEKVPEKPSVHNGVVSSALDAVIMKSLSRLPRDRFQSAAAFKNALAGVPGAKKKSKENVPHKVKLPGLAIPGIKFSPGRVSPVKEKFKRWGDRFQEGLTPFKHVLKAQTPQPRDRSRPAGNIDRRKLLIILISLLILLLIVVVAFAESAKGKEYTFEINNRRDTKVRSKREFSGKTSCLFVFFAAEKQEE